MEQTKFAKALALSAGVLVFSGAISYLIFAQSAWQPPSKMPPEGNVDAPINVGPIAQTKAGDLSVGGSFCVGEPCKIAVAPKDCGDGYFVKSIDQNGIITCAGVAGTSPETPPSPTPFNQPTLSSCNTDLNPKQLRIFVTGSTYTGYQVSDTAKADAICAKVASDYGVPGEYKALIHYNSHSIYRNPAEVLAPDARYWNGGRANEADPNCTWNLVANSPNEFFTVSDSNYLNNPIQYNEKGLAINNTVWTNFQPTGSGNWSGQDYLGQKCSPICYSPFGRTSYTMHGSSFNRNIGWANIAVSNYPYPHIADSQSRALYCVEQ